MNLRLKRTPGIYLVGFMASGKSTIGRHLAERLGWSFIDIDDEIEAAQRTRIADIFQARGEAEFRRIELETIREHVGRIGRGLPAVVALGGGAFVEAANRELLATGGISVWLDCPLSMVRQRVSRNDDRPLARDPQQFAALYASRRKAYRLADLRVPVETDAALEVVEAILSHPYFK
jgi:shikimate kinase